MIATRTFGLFAAAFAIIYSLAFELHWELFSWHPREGVFGWGQQPSIKGGPVMHWYGSLATGFLGAGAISLAAMPFLRERKLPDWIGWGVPLATILVWAWMLRVFFLR